MHLLSSSCERPMVLARPLLSYSTIRESGCQMHRLEVQSNRDGVHVLEGTLHHRQGRLSRLHPPSHLLSSDEVRQLQGFSDWGKFPDISLQTPIFSSPLRHECEHRLQPQVYLERFPPCVRSWSHLRLCPHYLALLLGPNGLFCIRARVLNHRVLVAK